MTESYTVSYIRSSGTNNIFTTSRNINKNNTRETTKLHSNKFASDVLHLGDTIILHFRLGPLTARLRNFDSVSSNNAIQF